MGMMINRRRAYCGKKLPYDYEVEYLQSSAAQYQYIDTGVIADINTEIILDITPIAINSNYYILGEWSSVCEFYLYHSSNLSGWQFGWGCDHSTYRSKNNTTRKLFRIFSDGTYSYMFLDGAQVEYQPINYQKPTTATKTLILFGGYEGNNRLFSSVKIHNFVIIKNGIKIIDFIPVVKDGVGYMYDKVSGQLFGNAGTGSFIIGPRKPEWVDLALPSGKLWADRNIGANSETDAGYYFSWGNINGHLAVDGYNFNDTNYNSSPGASLTGNISDTDAVHNAAYAILGSGATMPSTTDFQELFNANNTTNVWTTVNGVNGCLITSVRNGRSIFLPAVGCYDGTFRSQSGTSGRYFSSMIISDSTRSYSLEFSNSTINSASAMGKRLGLSVRAIKSNN